MTQVFSQLFDTAGDPSPSQPIEARLIATSSWLASGLGQVVDSANTTTDDTGTWTFDLTPTGDFEDSGAFYLITDPTGQHPITVPDTGGPYRMRDVMLQPPSGDTPAQPGLVSTDPYNALVLHANGLYAYVPVWFGRVGDPTPNDLPQSPTLAVRS